LKLFIHAPFCGVLGAYFPHMTLSIDLTPKRTVRGRKYVVWTIQRSVRMVQRSEEKGQYWV